MEEQNDVFSAPAYPSLAFQQSIKAGTVYKIQLDTSNDTEDSVRLCSALPAGASEEDRLALCEHRPFYCNVTQVNDDAAHCRIQPFGSTVQFKREMFQPRHLSKLSRAKLKLLHFMLE